MRVKAERSLAIAGGWSLGRPALARAAQRQPPARGVAGSVHRNDGLELECQGLAAGGDGVCRQPKGGPVVFVPRAVPGERLLAHVHAEQRGFARATKLRTTVASPHATEPPCPLFGTCGGCAWQNVAYAEQLAQKEKIVRDAMARIGGFRDSLPVRRIWGSDKQLGYRGKLTLAAAAGAPLALGLREAGSHDLVVPIDRCLLQSEAANEVLRACQQALGAAGLQPYDPAGDEGDVRAVVVRGAADASGLERFLVDVWVRRPRRDAVADAGRRMLAELGGERLAGVVMPTVRGRHASSKPSAPPDVVLGDGTLAVGLSGLAFDVSARSFFQVNPQQAERLCQAVKDAAALTGDEVVLDLYCGTGALGLSLASNAARIIGVEVEEAAVDDARRNAARNGIRNAEFLSGDLERIAGTLGQRLPRPDVVVVDPARAGLSSGVRDFLAASGARRVVYVSCNAATQARDLRDLCRGEQGRPYRLAWLQPLDMFPQTPHVEVVAALERTSS